MRGEWQGQLAARWGLHGEVQEQQFARLAEGQHPETGEQLVRHQTAREYVNAQGETVRTMEHRAGWDATFSAPKSVSLTALLAATTACERPTGRACARRSTRWRSTRRRAWAATSRRRRRAQWAVAKFEHDSSRPVDGYAAPQLHTHAVVFNVTETADGQTRALAAAGALQDAAVRDGGVSLGACGAVATAGLRDRARRAWAAGDQGLHARIPGGVESAAATDRRAHGDGGRARGWRRADRGASDARCEAAALARRGARAASETRCSDTAISRSTCVAEAAQRPGVELRPEQSGVAAHEGVSYARERGMEREAVADERTLMRDALKHTMGEARLPEVRAEFERRVQSHELIEVERRPGLARPRVHDRRNAGLRARADRADEAGPGHTRGAGRRQCARADDASSIRTLSVSQRHAVEDVLTSRDRMMALEGVAGGGKTTSLAAVREGAERAGYQVEGLAPTSRAAQKLAEAGIETQTLQRHLARGEQQDDGQKRLYVVDESSMASTKQIHTFVERLRENDRVLFVGDVRQHEAVEAGRPYAQLQEAGMRTARLDEIIRQKDPALKEAVEQLARGEVREAIGNLNSQGRVHEIGDRQERISEIAREYVRSPERTLVVSPDNASRREINEPHPSHDAERGQGQQRRAARACALRAAGRDRRGPAARAELRARRRAALLERQQASRHRGRENMRVCRTWTAKATRSQ